MGSITVRRRVRATPDVLWAVVTDVANYGRWVPATVMVTDPGTPRVGWAFAGHTGLPGWRFADPMVVEEWAPPRPGRVGTFAVRKRGRLLAGWARVQVRPTGVDGETDLHWTEEIIVRPLPLGRVLAPLTDLGTRWLFGRASAAMGRHAEQVQASARPAGGR